MSDSNSYRMLKMVGESSKNIEDAVEVALKSAAGGGEQKWAHITDLRASLSGSGKVDLWQVTVEVGTETD